MGRPLRILRFTASFLVSCNLKLLKSSLLVQLEGRLQLRLRNSLEQKLPWLSSLPGSSLCGPPAFCLPRPFPQTTSEGAALRVDSARSREEICPAWLLWGWTIFCFIKVSENLKSFLENKSTLKAVAGPEIWLACFVIIVSVFRKLRISESSHPANGFKTSKED